MNPKFYLFVCRSGKTEAVPIDTNGLTIVGELKKAIKKELDFLKDVSLEHITLHTTEAQPSLRPGIPLNDISKQPGYRINDDEHPMIIKVTASSMLLCFNFC